MMVQRSVFIAAAVLLTGCASHNSNVASATQKPEGPVIVRLVGRHQTVTVTSGPHGPLYSAETNDGKMVVANATLQELRREHPEVYQFLEPGVAAAADASMTPIPALMSLDAARE